MRKETCPHCLSSVHVAEYTTEELRTRVRQKLEKHSQLSPLLFVEVLTCEGFRAEDIRRELIRLADSKVIDMNEHRVWIVGFEYDSRRCHAGCE